MSIIVIKNLGERAIPFQNNSKTLLRHVQENYIDWMHTCGAKGKCTTCKAIIVDGTENLAALTEAEEKYRSRGELGLGERLACQAVVLGDITVRIPDESKLPHLEYSA